MSFDEATALELLEPGSYQCVISQDYWVVRGPNGGYLAAILAKVGEAHLDDPTRQLRSFTVHYLRPPEAAAARIEVRTEQLGRSVAFLRLSMFQGEKLVLLATGAWGTPREGFDFLGWPAPAVVGPEACAELSKVREEGASLPIHRAWEIRSVTENAMFGSGEAPDLTWWIRPRVPRRLDAALLVAISDAFPPPIFVTQPRPMAVPTLDLTIHIRALLSTVDWKPDDWVLARFTTQYASGGFLEEDGALWTADGVLIAHSRQLALSV